MFLSSVCAVDGACVMAVNLVSTASPVARPSGNSGPGVPDLSESSPH